MMFHKFYLLLLVFWCSFIRGFKDDVFGDVRRRNGWTALLLPVPSSPSLLSLTSMISLQSLWSLSFLWPPWSQISLVFGLSLVNGFGPPQVSLFLTTYPSDAQWRAEGVRTVRRPQASSLEWASNDSVL